MKTNCKTCDHKPHGNDGWCYMFKDKPQEEFCAQHTGYRQITDELLIDVIVRLSEAFKEKS